MNERNTESGSGDGNVELRNIERRFDLTPFSLIQPSSFEIPVSRSLQVDEYPIIGLAFSDTDVERITSISILVLVVS